MARKAGKKKGGSKPKHKPKTKTPPLPASIPPPRPVEPRPAPEAIDVLAGVVLRNVLRRLPLADLLRAALACHRWRRVAARCLPRAPPLLGYFFHPVDPPPRPPAKNPERAHHDAVFAPLGGAASSPRHLLGFAPDAARSRLHDCHQGLLLLEPPAPPATGALPRLLVLDPATRRHALLPPPPRRAVPDDRRWRATRRYVGSALLSRAHPSRLCFEAVCFAVEEGRPRAWVASVDDSSQCRWRALPRDADVEVDFDARLLRGRCVHAAGKLYWHICNSGRVLALDPATLRFSYLLAPAVLGDRFGKYRVGETPDDGRLCIATVENQVMQLWVRAETRPGAATDNGWVVEKEMDLRRVYDTVPDLPRDTRARMASIWITDIDAGRTGKLFIQMSGYGRYSFDLKTRKLERLVMNGGMEYGDPIYAYFLAWPPAFLAQA